MCECGCGCGCGCGWVGNTLSLWIDGRTFEFHTSAIQRYLAGEVALWSHFSKVDTTLTFWCGRRSYFYPPFSCLQKTQTIIINSAVENKMKSTENLPVAYFCLLGKKRERMEERRITVRTTRTYHSNHIYKRHCMQTNLGGWLWRVLSYPNLLAAGVVTKGLQHAGRLCFIHLPFNTQDCRDKAVFFTHTREKIKYIWNCSKCFHFVLVWYWKPALILNETR